MSHQDLKDWLDLEMVDDEQENVATKTHIDQTDKPADKPTDKSTIDEQIKDHDKEVNEKSAESETAAQIATATIDDVKTSTLDIPRDEIIVDVVAKKPVNTTDDKAAIDNQTTNDDQIFDVTAELPEQENTVDQIPRDNQSDHTVEDSETPANDVTPDQNEDGVITLSNMWQSEQSEQDSGDLGDRLLSAGILDASMLTQARTIARQSAGKQLVDIFISMGLPEDSVREIQAQLAGLPFEKIDPDSIDGLLLNRLGVDYCKTNQVIPLRIAGNRVVLGVTNPQHLFMIDEVRSKLGKPIKVVLVTAADIATVIDLFSEDDESDLVVDDIIKDIQEDDVEVVEAGNDNLDIDLEKQAGESPVIRFVNYLIGDAVRNGASDIHIEPQEKRLRIRYRIDGILFEAMNPPAAMHSAIVSRLKIMANLDISERRLPQDGRIRAVVHGRKLDLRVSTLPTGQGEKTVLRILDGKSIKVSLEDLGMPENTMTIWNNQVNQPHGILLITGPTGSGKSTTLYASLGKMDCGKLNISTVEDPIEYHLDSINQIQVHDKIGMTFSSSLRSLLRQDPDVIMVGEIRDEETGHIAVQAALTGHLVLSTLHTNDAPSSVTRLINIGIEPFLIGAAINGVLAQRLVRRICDKCKKQVTPTDELTEHLEVLGLNTTEIYEGEGCDKCRNTGYSGRVGLYELLILDDILRDEITKKPNVSEFRRLCVERGMQTLRIDGFNKVAKGETTIEEVLRVTHSSI